MTTDDLAAVRIDGGPVIVTPHGYRLPAAVGAAARTGGNLAAEIFLAAQTGGIVEKMTDNPRFGIGLLDNLEALDLYDRLEQAELLLSTLRSPDVRIERHVPKGCAWPTLVVMPDGICRAYHQRGYVNAGAARDLPGRWALLAHRLGLVKLHGAWLPRTWL